MMSAAKGGVAALVEIRAEEEEAPSLLDRGTAHMGTMPR